MDVRGNESDATLLQHLRRHARSEDLDLFVSDGWLPLVADCHEAMTARFPDYELLAVKEKYGQLAFQAFPRPWVPGGTAWTPEEHEACDDITDAYRERSAEVCERCGQPGTLRVSRAHMLTLCDEHDTSVADPVDGRTGRRFLRRRSWRG